MLTTYSDILQNAPFRSQIFKIFFASGGKGGLTPLTKILRTFLNLGMVELCTCTIYACCTGFATREDVMPIQSWSASRNKSA